MIDLGARLLGIEFHLCHFSRCVSFEKLLNFPVSQFPHLKNGANYSQKTETTQIPMNRLVDKQYMYI